MTFPHREPFSSTGIGRRMDQYLRETGIDMAVLTDAQASFQVYTLRHVLEVLGAALRDTGIPGELGDRIIDLVMYGSMPNPAETHLRQQMMRNMAGLSTPRPWEFDKLDGE